MKFAKLAFAAVILTTTGAVVPAVASAQEAAATATAGATVYGSDGMEIGVIEAVQGDTALLVVDGMKAPVPTAAFGTSEKGTSLNATKAQVVAMLQEAQQQAMAARDAALVVGAEAVTAQNAPLGTVLEIEGDNVVIARGGDEANKVTLLRDHFVGGENGLMALLTNEQIDAAMAGSAPAADGAGE